MTLWTLGLRELTSRPGRAILTLLSVVIGVAAVLSVAAVTATVRGAFSDVQQRFAGRAVLEVTSQWGGGFDEGATAQLERTPGVKAALPLLQQPTILYSKEKRLRLLMLGVAPDRQGALSGYELEAGSFRLGQRQGVLAADFARGLGVAVGDDVQVLTRLGVRKIRVTGLLARKGAALLGQGAVLLVALNDAQTLMGAKGRVDRIHLVLDDAADESAVADEVARRLPDGLRVGSRSGGSALVAETMAGIEQALELAGSLSLALAGFVIANTFFMNVSERRRQLGILRAIGATRRQVMILVLSEGMLLGIVGVLLGIPLGVGGTRLLALAMERVLDVPLPLSELTAGPYVLAAGLGIVVSLLASYLPARKASRVSPMEAISGAVLEEAEGVPRAATVAGSLILFCSTAALAAVAAGRLSVKALPPAEVLTLVGLSLMIPALVDPAIRCCSWFHRWPARPEARLARLQVVRRRTRAGLTASVFLVAMAFGAGIGSTALNTARDVRDWGRRTITSDFQIWATLPDTATGQTVALPQGVREQIADMKCIAAVDTVRYLLGKADEQAVVVIAREFPDRDHLALDLRQRAAGDVWRRLRDGEAVIGTALAHRLQLDVGDNLSLQTAAGPTPLQVAGVANDYTCGGMTVYLHRAAAERLLKLEGVDALIVNSRTEALAETHTRLQAFCEQQGLLLQSLADLRTLLDSIVASFLASLWALLVLGFVVASLGICNTLTMDILERTREIGLLRVVGMTRRQVRKMILIQSLIIAAIGLLPGAIVGAIFSWLANASAIALLGHSIGTGVDPVWIAACLAGALVVVIAATIWPARRAASLELKDALQYE